MLEILDKSSSQLESKDILSILKEYTLALQLLDDYDHQNISRPKVNSDTYILTYEECVSIVDKMREEHDSDVFGIERGGEFESSINVIYATFDGEELYSSFEEKSAHLLYFLVKNHGFIDGNKRIAATIFIYFLEKNGYLYVDGVQVIDNKTLVTLTIMLAESNPNEKELLINLIMNLLKV